MGSKVIRNVTKILKATSGRLFGRVTTGTGRAEELTASDVRDLLEVYTTSEVDGLIETIELTPGPPGPPGPPGADGADGDTGPQGPAGPNEVSGTTATALDGILRGTGSVVGTVTVGAGLAYSAGSLTAAATGTNTGDQNLFSTIVVSGQSNVVADSTSDTLTLVAGTNITITTDAATDTITIAASGGGLSGTGSVDNAVLRADGTGGATLQNSNWIIADNATASPNNTVNHASIQATGGTKNVSVSIVPKGTGAVCLQVPDGGTGGGNVRGANAIDLQTLRSNANQVASGGGCIVLGTGNRASGTDAVAIGTNCVSTGTRSVAIGNQCTSSGIGSFATGSVSTCSSVESGFAAGYYVSVSGLYGAAGFGNGTSVTGTSAFGSGNGGSATLHCERVHAAGAFAATGDAQSVCFVLRIKTTNATPTTMMLDGASTRLTIPAGKVFAFTARITGIKSDGTAVAEYLRKGVIKRIVNTTSLVGSIETIGTDIEDNASTDVAITADDTNEALQINVTGIASETWRWVAVVEGIEIAYGV